jgi:hypothetical protein
MAHAQASEGPSGLAVLSRLRPSGTNRLAPGELRVRRVVDMIEREEREALLLCTLGQLSVQRWLASSRPPWGPWRTSSSAASSQSPGRSRRERSQGSQNGRLPAVQWRSSSSWSPAGERGKGRARGAARLSRQSQVGLLRDPLAGCRVPTCRDGGHGPLGDRAGNRPSQRASRGSLIRPERGSRY